MTNLKKRVASHKILQFLQNNKVIFFFQKKSVESDHWRLLKKKIANIEGVATLNIKNKRDRKEIQPFIFSRVFSLKKTSPIANANERFAKRSTRYLQEKSLACGNCGRPLHLQGKCTVFCETQNDKSVNPWLCQDAPLPAEKDVTTLLDSSFSLNENNTQPSDQETRVDESLHLQNKSTPQQNVHLESENRFKVVEQICDLLYGPNLILASDSLEKLVGLSHQLKEDSNLVFIGGWDGEQLINHLDSLKLLETSQDIWKEGLSFLSSSYAKPYLFLYSLLEKRKRSLIYSLKEKMQALTRSLQERKAQQMKEQ